MATAAAEPKTGKKSVAESVGVETVLLSDLLKVCDPLDVHKAWAAGDIEFGHQSYCVTGPVGKIGSVLVVEDGFEWSGPKTRMHKNLRDLSTEEPPKVEKYKKYVWTEPKVFGEEAVQKPQEISKDEALAAIALRVRLTDKGLGTA